MSTFLSCMEQLTKEALEIAALMCKHKKQSNRQITGAQTGCMEYPKKFNVVSAFAVSLKDVLAVSDRYHYGGPYAWYHAIRYIMQYAFIDYPVPGINYEKVFISRGHLWNTSKAQAKPTSGGITFTWDNNIGIAGALPDDRCILAAYSEQANQCVFIAKGHERYAGQATLAVPGFRGHKVHTWLGFISADGNRVANSLYTGMVTIT